MELKKIIRNLLVKLCVIGISVFSASSFASVIYSGIQNIAFTSVAGSSHYTVDLAQDMSGNWDNLQFDMFDFGPGRSFAAVTSWSGSEVSLAYGLDANEAQHYSNNDSLSGNFGSGSKTLWNVDALNNIDAGQFKNGTAFAGMQLNSFGSNSLFGPLYGWVQLKVDNYQNLDNLGSTITLIDWAYETSGQMINAGQGRTALPEPAGLSLLLLGVLFAVWCRRTSIVKSNA